MVAKDDEKAKETKDIRENQSRLRMYKLMFEE
jgi:hypothetical protein